MFASPSTGRRVPRFKDNLPGKDWVKTFLKRHNDPTVRFATNIKRSRAALNGQQMQDYIENLRETLEGVPPNAIFNYDETNLTDNPGQKKVLTKRGMKYPERIINSSKSCIRRRMEKISENSASNLISGFRKCGIVPCDVGPLLERLHNNHNNVINQGNIPEIEKSFLESLENKRRVSSSGKEEKNFNSSRKKALLMAKLVLLIYPGLQE